MSACQSIKKRKRRVCLGDLVDPITIQSREIQTALFNTVDFGEAFEPINAPVPQRLSLIETVEGVIYFDGVGVDKNVTHKIYIPYDPLVTAQNWVEFESRRFDILRVEDLDERHEFQKLICTERGLTSAEGSKK